MSHEPTEGPESKLAEQYLGAIGSLAVDAWRLEHAVEELGLGLGVAAGPALAKSTDSVRQRLESSGLPPWADGASEAQIGAWLSEVDQALSAYADLLTCSGRRRDSVPVRISQEEGTVQVPIAEYLELRGGMRQLLSQSEVLLSQLAMKLRSGGCLYGFENVARSLYVSLTTADPIYELLPERQQDAHFQPGRGESE